MCNNVDASDFWYFKPLLVLNTYAKVFDYVALSIFMSLFVIICVFQAAFSAKYILVYHLVRAYVTIWDYFVFQVTLCAKYCISSHF